MKLVTFLQAGTERIGAVIAKDIAMTAAVLKLANSAFFSLRHTVTSASEAVGFLVTSAERTAPSGAVVDLFTESCDAEAVRALLATGMGSLLKGGIELISTWTLRGSAQSAAHQLLQHTFPFRRNKHLHLAFRILLPQEITLPLPSQKWHFTLGDSDGA